jgi:hypothetical protein
MGQAAQRPFIRSFAWHLRSQNCSSARSNRCAGFLRWGLAACDAEWKLLCGTHTCSNCGGSGPSRIGQPGDHLNRDQDGRSKRAERRHLPAAATATLPDPEGC